MTLKPHLPRRLAVVLMTEIHVFSFPSKPELLTTYQTAPNPKGGLVPTWAELWCVLSLQNFWAVLLLFFQSWSGNTCSFKHSTLYISYIYIHVHVHLHVQHPFLPGYLPFTIFLYLFLFISLFFSLSLFSPLFFQSPPPSCRLVWGVFQRWLSADGVPWHTERNSACCGEAVVVLGWLVKMEGGQKRAYGGLSNLKFCADGQHAIYSVWQGTIEYWQKFINDENFPIYSIHVHVQLYVHELAMKGLTLQWDYHRLTCWTTV